MIVFTFRGRPIFARGKAMVAYTYLYTATRWRNPSISRTSARSAMCGSTPR